MEKVIKKIAYSAVFYEDLKSIYSYGLQTFGIIMLRCNYIILFMFLFCSINGQSQNNNVILSDSIIEFAEQQLGIKYKYASANPKVGFDCSGFVNYVFNHYDIKVPHASKDFAEYGCQVPIDDCRPGDVIVFKGTNPKSKVPGHVGIITKNQEGQLLFIHSSSDKKNSGIKISDFNAYNNYKKRFIKIIRIPELG
jgi:cell wall-associated NlpC family hydrolase